MQTVTDKISLDTKIDQIIMQISIWVIKAENVNHETRVSLESLKKDKESTDE